MYGPTTERATQHPEELHALYNALTTFNNNLKNLSTSMFPIAGDFNGKVGKADDFETCIGKWTRGRRNDNGQKLVEWCDKNNKLLSNITFKHKQSHVRNMIKLNYQLKYQQSMSHIQPK